MMRAPLFLLTLAGFLMLFPADLSAGEVDPGFAETLKNMAPDDFASGIVCMTDRLDIVSFERSLLYPVRLPAKERHERVILALQEKASTAQKSVPATPA